MLGAGPLMNEPMYGVGYVVEKIEMGRKIAGSAASEREIQELCGKELWSVGGGGAGGGTGTGAAGGTGTGTGAGTGTDGVEKGDKGGLLVGQLISDATEAFRLAFLSCPVSPVNTANFPPVDPLSFFCVYCTQLHDTVIHCNVLYYAVLYRNILHCTVSQRTVLHCTTP